MIDVSFICRDYHSAASILTSPNHIWRIIEMNNIVLIRKRILILGGSILLIIGGFLPWISIPNLFGISEGTNLGIEVGWEGDGMLTTAVGLLLLLGELVFGRVARKWGALTGVVLLALAVTVVLLDFRRILEIDPEAGFFAATDIGIYVTFLGALLALIGCFHAIGKITGLAAVTVH
jgi:hypothetical protein